ncbi:uncharacterized protein LOC121247568 [Juglans microcarpa x Juglans regia]|uniref:uncharacterized protein LOC121247568 n=1 Tax=Juglans microcarpa x Juglans regia TaxID=2249226 RepID=UPI001B7EBAC7|nr:uncharacterized protein LOC121247568 [Juglans microcarpa x Juglans regia]
MSTLRFTAKLPEYLISAGAATARRSTWIARGNFVSAAPRPLQYSEKDKDQDADAHERTIEAAEAVTKGAREVRQTCEFLRDTASSTAKSATKMTEKVSETAENITEKTKGTVSGVWGTAKNAAEIIKDKVLDKD